MEIKLGVIRITRKADIRYDPDKYFYLSEIKTDINGHLIADKTYNILNAMKFKYDLNNKNEMNRINSLIEFIKTFYVRENKYQIELIPITLNY